MTRVDYDRIAQYYDVPEREHGVDPHLLAFVEAADDDTASALRVLDVGCGTGSQLSANRQRLPHVSMVGVDRFAGMLRLARRRCADVHWVQGDAASLPLSSGSCDYATNQFSYPHVRNTPRLIEEIFRVLRPGGRFVMTNIDPWAMPGWAIYRYFPEAMALDFVDFVPVNRFVELMRRAGFGAIDVARTHLSRTETLAGFLEYASTRHRTSQLMAIADEAYEAGLREIRRAADEAGGRDAVFESPLVVVTIAGTRPLP